MSRTGQWLRHAALAVLLASLARAEAPADPWQTRLPAFSAEAAPRADAVPILLYFTAPWCGFCKQMERGALADAEVRAQVGRLRAHKIDFDAERGLVERFGVRGIPALVLTNERGEVIDRLTGAVSKETLLGWIAAGEVEAKRRAQGSQERINALRVQFEKFSSTDVHERKVAIQACWEAAARGDEIERGTATWALAGLAKIAQADTALRELLWRTGLLHADLAVRVTAANLLREVKASEQAKPYDPWAEAPEREAAVASAFAK